MMRVAAFLSCPVVFVVLCVGCGMFTPTNGPSPAEIGAKAALDKLGESLPAATRSPIS